jgi:polyvinyl alcohol dehydrogenase (cytochrome)
MERRAGPIGPLVLSILFAMLCTAAGGHERPSWPSSGQNLHATRAAPHERAITVATAASLQQKWAFTAHGSVSATPAVEGNALYVPDWGGWLHKIDTRDGHAVWSYALADRTGIPGAVSRTAPALAGDTLYVGTLQGAYLVAVDKRTGNVRWKTQLDPHVAAQITESPVVHDGVVYIGVSSREELLASNSSYPCCSFRGSVVAVSADTGAILWQTRMVPEGYSGGAVWGGTPVVDERRRAVYVTTGNNYTVPPDTAACLDAAGDDPFAAEACLDEADRIDAVVALDLDTGAVRWGHRLQGADAWTGACFYGLPWCPEPMGDDYDIGTGAMLFQVKAGGHGPARDLLGAGQKSGIYWALDPDDGHVVWSTLVGPGGIMGGILWGVATDGERIYVPLADSNGVTYTLSPSGETIDRGSWAALDPATGAILWQTPDPTPRATDTGAATIANGVMFVGSMGGGLYALDGSSGAILWSYPTTASVACGPAVADGVVYWGTGYTSFGVGTPGNQLYAFAPH